jgi:hypothetical protein
VVAVLTGTTDNVREAVEVAEGDETGRGAGQASSTVDDGVSGTMRVACHLPSSRSSASTRNGALRS